MFYLIIRKLSSGGRTVTPAVGLAYELRDTKIKVNAAHPGHVQTDMGGANAPMQIVDGAKTSVALATLAADGPSGSFSHLGQVLSW